MTRPAAPHELPTRLAAVLQAALQAPGNRARFHAAGLIQTSRWGLERPTLAANWQVQFAQLPPLEKAAVRQAPGQYLAGVADIIYRGSTSGSRSRSYTFFANRAWNEQRLRSRQGFLNWWGIDPAVPIVNLASRLMPGREADWAIVGPVTLEFIESLRANLANRPWVGRGYPSRLCEIASLLRQPLPGVKAVICTGELLFQHQRELLEQRFQAPVINEYGCHEAAIRGFTCPEFGRIHLDEQSCFLETVNGALVTTDLWNETMPLVRYQCGDRVRLDATPCPCGRPGLTVQVLGRIEDRIGTRHGLKLPGEVALPTLPGLLHYRLQRQSPTLVAAQIQVDNALSAQTAAVAEASLQTWVNQTLGDHTLSTTHQAAVASPALPPEEWSDHRWLTTLTQNSLSGWLATSALTKGEERTLALVLRALLAPCVIGMELPKVIQQQVVALASSPTAVEPAVETMKVRILLLACSCIRDRPTSHHLYTQAVARQQKLATAPDAALQLDCLIPALHLPASVLSPTWATAAMAETWPLDPLHVQHLLAAFEVALQRRSPTQRSPALRHLRPPLAVLVGDLSFWAVNLTTAHLHHWSELLQAPPNLTSPSLSLTAAAPAPAFLASWLSWRQALIHEPLTAAEHFTALTAAAGSDTEKARLQVERGYFDILRHIPLDPEAWLPIIETHAADLTAAPTDRPASLTPWLPIVNALVQPLYEQGQPELAYRCLLAATLTSRQQSAFERLTTRFNQKQSVLVDLCPQPSTSA